MTIHGRIQTLCAAAAFAVAINVAFKSAASGATIYVDGKLKDTCKGNYSVAARDASGKDGDAYRTICEAADIAKAGDTVVIREGTYNTTASKQENDALWPKNSGTPDKPITFKAKEGEKAVLGGLGDKFPGWDDTIGLAGAVITFKDVSNIVVEGIEVRNVTGWLFARKASHITIRNCVFADAVHDFKGTARIIYSSFVRYENCKFINSSGDCMQIESSDRNVVENCVFNCAQHCLLAIRGGSYNVVRNCKFDNPYYDAQGRSEHLTEVYDAKLDRRDPNSYVYEEPAYDHTKYNLWEHNYFGYMPVRKGDNAGIPAMQYSGQNGIIRLNVFNQPLDYTDPNLPGIKAGGVAVAMRWGGSWDGWNANRKIWVGEGIEAGYVTGNRFFNNTFYGFDSGCVFVPADDVIKDLKLNPPPMEEKNPPKQFDKKFEFSDNEFKNNIMLPSAWVAHIRWGNMMHMNGKPGAILMDGLLDAMRFQNNDFYAPEGGEFKDWLIYIHKDQFKYKPALTPEQADKELPKTFSGNMQKDPMVVDIAKADFRLKEGSPMIDAGAFLTVAVGAGKDSKELVVKDAGYFYDGFGIPGEKGDLIQLKSQKDPVRIVAIDYKTNTLKLEKAVSWADGDGVALPYAGAAPDVGAIENSLPADQTIGVKTAK